MTTACVHTGWENVLLFVMMMMVIATPMVQTKNGLPQTECPMKCRCSRERATCVNQGYKYIPSFPENTTNLIFNGNFISVVSAESLANLTNLRLTSIQLNNNSITHVHSDSFILLQNISRLELMYNELTRVPTFCGNPNVETLPYLEQIRLSNNLLTSIDHGDFDGSCLPKLSIIYLNYNLIKLVPNNAFSYLPALKRLEMNRVSLAYPAKAKFPLFAPFAFNISSLRYLDISNRIHTFYTTHNASTFFKNCPGLTVLKMNNIDLYTDDENVLKTLLSPLKKLQDGSFVRTSIRTFPPGLLSSMADLRKVDFTYCKISSLNMETFSNLKNMSHILMPYNTITTVNQSSFPEDVLKSVKLLDLSSNPFACTCNLVWFVNWIKQNKAKMLMYPHNYYCYTPAEWFDRRLVNFDPSYRSCHPISPYVIMAISTCSGTFVIFLVSFIIYRYRWDIKYHIYMMRARKKGYEDIGDNDEFLYDAFVAYSHEERKWVLSQLIPKIEDIEHFKLCLHERDFQIGKFIIDNICDEINRSRKTLIILSNNFTKSQWCQLELALAQKRHLEEGNAHLVVVLIDAIESKNMSNSVRVLLNTTTFIEWTIETTGNELFWGRLINALQS